MVKAHICSAKRATSRRFERGCSTASASGPAATAATVAAAGIRRRRRRNGTATAAPTAATPPARTARRSAFDGRERRIRPASIGRPSASTWERPGREIAAPPRVNRMAALWRPILLAPTRSTPCFGSASSPP
ncbi:MAG: MYXO-CTERM sorting domain-containing protein [Solirubrobacterales bacterium]